MRPLLAHERQVLRTLLVVPDDQHLAVVPEPLDAPRTVAAAGVLLPVGLMGAARRNNASCAFARSTSSQTNSSAQDGDIDVEEELEVGVKDAQLDRFGDAGQRHARARDIGAAHNLDRTLAKLCVGHPWSWPSSSSN
jgi:hypothetical protein